MLTRHRDKIAPITNGLARICVKLHIKPNYLTILSLILMLIGFYILCTYSNILFFIITLLVSSILDAVDGAVARYTNQVTGFGSFLDSTIDRINDFIAIIGLAVLGLSTILVYPLVMVSFLISYVRAKAESLGIKMEGEGVIERSERLITLIITYIIILLVNKTIAEYIVLALLVLSIITLIQRLIHVYRNID